MDDANVAAAIGAYRRVPVVVWDLDGCLCQMPDDPRIKQHFPDPDFWSAHYASCPAPHPEMLALFRALLSVGWRAIVLTARPLEYRKVTVEWLLQHKLVSEKAALRLRCAGDLNALFRLGVGMEDIDPPVTLVMSPYKETSSERSQSFKAHMMRQFVRYYSIDVKFAVEDHKPVADRLRQYVPVLLYECVRAGPKPGT